MKITFCIPSKNNLRYLKNSILSIEKNSLTKHDIIVFIDADNDGTESWLKEKNIKYLKNETNIPKGIAYAYNRCIEATTTEVVCMFHADMHMAKGFDVGIFKYLKPKTVVSGTRIEPPLHPQGLEKIVQNFGMYPEDFEEKNFDNFISETQLKYQDKTTKGIFAPWAIYKEDIVSIGMHDEHLHSYHEDSDIFNRFILNQYDIIQSWEAYVYHLTCRGGQFQDGIEKITNDPIFHLMKQNAFKNYVRKWGTFIKNDEFQHPIISPKYDIGFRIKHCNSELLEILEPWCNNVLIDDEMQVLTSFYLDKEQKNTIINLSEKIKSTPFEKLRNNIIIEIDRNTFIQQDFNTIQQLPNIIKDSGEIGIFEIGNLWVTINSMAEYQNDLIYLS
jgi:glycosyltransferase involved in cell wall biosynthesis